jgi:hypothetical protein
MAWFSARRAGAGTALIRDQIEKQTTRLRERSGMTPGPTVQDETANQSDDSAAGGVQGHHADQQECEHHQGCAALPIAVGACDHNPGNAD